MATKIFALPDDQRRHFSEIDQSILRWSVELGKAVLQVDSMKRTISDLYEARLKQMNAAIVSAGIDPADAAAAKIDGEGKLIVELAAIGRTDAAIGRTDDPS